MSITNPPITVPVNPDFGAVGAAGALEQVVGALLTYGLLIAVGMVIACASAWAISANQSNPQTAARAKTGVLVAVCGAALCGAALGWANWLLGIGAHL